MPFGVFKEPSIQLDPARKARTSLHRAVTEVMVDGKYRQLRCAASYTHRPVSPESTRLDDPFVHALLGGGVIRVWGHLALGST